MVFTNASVPEEVSRFSLLKSVVFPDQKSFRILLNLVDWTVCLLLRWVAETECMSVYLRKLWRRHRTFLVVCFQNITSPSYLNSGLDNVQNPTGWFRVLNRLVSSGIHSTGKGKGARISLIWIFFVLISLGEFGLMVTYPGPLAEGRPSLIFIHWFLLNGFTRDLIIANSNFWVSVSVVISWQPNLPYTP